MVVKGCWFYWLLLFVLSERDNFLSPLEKIINASLFFTLVNENKKLKESLNREKKKKKLGGRQHN